jgi:hypothetical protein
MVPGAFVRVLFPTHEDPRRPGLRHIGYVLGATAGYAMVDYSTSQPWPADTPLPAGARLFSAREAMELNQSRGFLLRLDVLARLPMTRDWFPDIDRPRQGILAVAPGKLQTELIGIAANIARRHRDLFDIRVP